MWHDLRRAICQKCLDMWERCAHSQKHFEHSIVGFIDQSICNFEIMWGVGNLNPLIGWLFFCLQEGEANFQRFKHATIHAMLGLRSFTSRELLNWKGRRLGTADSRPAIGHGHHPDASVLRPFFGGKEHNLQKFAGRPRPGHPAPPRALPREHPCTSPATPGCRPPGSCPATPRASSIATSDAIMWDQKTGRSRGSGFVSFRNQQNAQTAINELMVHSLLLIASNV